ncbi:hypothetical protein [Luteibaculum oceani]|uniref:Uncharacterized protein n=1 Tax=Luteibaculum oceani TaxID=1294296 RepID=A0A5C6VJT6_9FLAO|nr:hypothetical protein [Luteibaculum oceani]TXC85250.1 hypothetical protein FRX97_01100 [Luteibaculum oceani]
MKNILKLALPVLACVVIIACKKEDKEETPAPNKGSVTYDGKTYTMNRVIIEDNGLDTSVGLTNIDIIMLTEGVVTHESNGQIDSVSGSGSVLVLELYSDFNGALKTGVYNFADTTVSINSIGDAYIIADYNFTTDEGGSYTQFESGSANITSASSSRVAFNFSGTAAQLPISGSFSGTFSFYVDNSATAKISESFPALTVN